MDNFTHTLFGLALAKAGGEQITPLATTTLVIASNMPDIDSVMQFRGAFYNLEYHRGITHSFVGLFVLSLFLTLILVFLDKRFRLRHDMFRRPIRPLRIFGLAYLAGLLHLFLDYTNNYGVRPFLPFSDRWFYGDFIFVADPWIWLILGSSVVWLTTSTKVRGFFWLLVSVVLSLIMAMALRESAARFPLTIPLSIRIIWFVGLAIIIFGTLANWGRFGGRLARYSLLLLFIYEGGMWMAKQSAMEQARNSLAFDNVRSVSVWATPANPLVWQAAATTDDKVYSRFLKLRDEGSEWQEANRLPPEFDAALRRDWRTNVFMKFTRYAVADVQENADGYTVNLRDVRFDLKLNALLDHEYQVKAATLRWF
jgi:inner membrane protein